MIIGHVQSDRSWDPHMSGASVVISPPFQRKGFGTEAISLMLNYLFNFTVAHNISVAIEEWNTPAQLFATHLGFQPVGKRQQIVYKNGRFHDDLVFDDILKPEWKEASHAADR